MRFGGSTYDEDIDRSRLKGQLADVFKLMEDGAWRSLREISLTTGHPEASVSARLRDIRKKEFFKNYTTNSRRRTDNVHVSYGGLMRRRTAGTWEYRVVRSEPEDEQGVLFNNRRRDI